MTDITTWLSGCRPVRWCARFRLVRWLWRYRWPGAPLTAALLLTIAQRVYPPAEHGWIDQGLVVGIVVSTLLLLVVLIVGTERPWGPRSTGILHFVMADVCLYGLLILPGRFGWSAPWPDLSAAFLRANLAIAAPVLVIGYSDWIVDWWRGRREEREERMA